MILRSVYTVVVIIIFINITIFTNHGLAASLQQHQELSISECAAKIGECDESKGRPVCGTDDQTYPSRCHLIRVQCSGHQVSIKYRGPCKACTEAREYALKHRSKKPPKFIPRCKRDGTYALIQCLANTGCWCSDVTGKPIENTSVRTGKPKCRAYSKKANIRRSPQRSMTGAGNRGGGRRSCTPDDRIAFNGNLLKIFHTEYLRMLQQKQHQHTVMSGRAGGGGGGSVDKLLDTLDVTHDNKVVIDWKFANLDGNKNEMLDKIEYRELKKLVKRAVKPRRCGRAFGKFCDVDRDERLSRLEWSNCLSKDGLKRYIRLRGTNTTTSISTKTRLRPSASSIQHKFNHDTYPQTNRATTLSSSSLSNTHHNIQTQMHASRHHSTALIHHNNNKSFGIDSDFEMNGAINGGINAGDDGDEDFDEAENENHFDYDEEVDYEDGEDTDTENMGFLNAFGSPTKFPSIHFLVPNAPNSSRKESETESNCLTDQAAALEDQNHGSGFMYVPECTPDGRYQRVQCYRSTPYCWCVNEETGKNIIGSSVKDRRPQCDSLYTTIRPMKGCPEPRKAAFLKELKEYLKTYIIAGAYTGSSSNKWSNEDERIASLSFVVLDKNKNKAWERKEWKTFRELVTNTKTLRKCGKKMPRYCDANSDKKITLNEWIACLQAQNYEILHTQPQTPTNGSVSTKPLKLIGSNPLEQYLKD